MGLDLEQIAKKTSNQIYLFYYHIMIITFYHQSSSEKKSHIPVIFLLAANSTKSLPKIINYAFVADFLDKSDKF